jgi:hypothetical protein
MFATLPLATQACREHSRGSRMIIRFNPRAVLALSGAFVLCLLAIGLPYWALAYSQVDLPNALYGWGMLVLGLAAASIQATGTAGFLPTLATLGFVAPTVTMSRVVYDVAIDPTSHNLWPFEVAIAAFVGVFVVFSGAFVGALLRMAIRRRGEG